MDEERCVDNCAGKLIRSNHRLMATYVQLMPRMVQRRMEEIESKAAENAKLEAAAAANVGPESQVAPVAMPVTATEAPQTPLELSTNEVGLLGAAPLAPATENILDSGTSTTASLTVGQNTESVPYTPPTATSLSEDVSVSSASVPQKSTEHRVGPE